MGQAARSRHHHRCERNRRECSMPQANDLSRSLAALDQDSTLVAVIEISQSSWLVGGIVPGVNRQPLKKLAADETALLQLLSHSRQALDRGAPRGYAVDQLCAGRRRLPVGCLRREQDPLYY